MTTALSHLHFKSSALSRLLGGVRPVVATLRAPDQSFMEALESRQMLSTINHPHTGIIIEGEFHTFTAKSSLADRTFTDNNDNKVVFNFTGAGTATIFQANNGELVTLEFDDTQAASGLLVNVTKNKTGTGVTTIASIDIEEGAFGVFNAAKVNVTSSFRSIDGPVKSLTLGNFGGNLQSSIVIGGSASDKTSITLGAVHDLSLRTSTNVTALKVTDWQDTDDSQDFFEASALGTLHVNGRNEVKSKGEIVTSKLAGDFEADINLTYTVPIGTDPRSPAANPTVSTVQISGSVDGNLLFNVHKVNNIHIKGNATGSIYSSSTLGPVQISGNVGNFDLTGTKGINNIKVGRASNFDVLSEGVIGPITAVDWVGGTLTAMKVNNITTTGSRAVTSKGEVVTPAVAGDFQVDMLINSGLGSKANTNALGNVTIKGSVLGDGSYKGNSSVGDWIVAGGAGQIKVGGNADHFFLDVRVRDGNKGNLGSLKIDGASNQMRVSVHGKSGAITLTGGGDDVAIEIGGGVGGGDLASFTSGKELEDMDLQVNGVIGSISTGNLDETSIHANKVGNVSSKATKATKSEGEIAGTWEEVNLHITGEGTKAGQNVLGPVNIAGYVDDSHWRVHGNSGPVTVAAFYNSIFTVGVKDSVNDLPIFQSDFELFGGKTATLTGFTVTGKGQEAGHPSFSESIIAAGTFTNVSLKLVNAGAEETNGFFAATKIGNYARQTGPNTWVRVSNKTAVGTYDTTGLYSLQIVPAAPVV